MKIISYSSISIGMFLIAMEIIFKFNDLLGYLVTTSGILLTLLGVMLNKKMREFLINLIINFFKGYEIYRSLKKLYISLAYFRVK